MSKILIVEDESKHMKYMHKAVSGEGKEITEVHDEDEALDRMENEQFDLVITDMSMKSENAGMKVLRGAMQLAAPPEVIMITAYDDIETGPDAMSEGAYRYLEKKPRGWPLKLGQVVENALSEKKTLQ